MRAARKAAPIHQLLNIGVVGIVLFLVAKIAFDFVEEAVGVGYGVRTVSCDLRILIWLRSAFRLRTALVDADSTLTQYKARRRRCFPASGGSPDFAELRRTAIAPIWHTCVLIVIFLALGGMALPDDAGPGIDSSDQTLLPM